jgi:hypothetical protein
MNRKDLYIGATVYHNMMVHWGAGKIVGSRIKCYHAGCSGYRDALHWEVQWEHREQPTFELPRCLRKTPNRQRLEALAVAQAIRGAKERLPIEIIESHPKGGLLTHLRVKGQWTALCGYKPQTYRTTQMRDRTGWYNSPGFRPCEKCKKRLQRLKKEEQH